jgi:hypothetical protein
MEVYQSMDDYDRMRKVIAYDFRMVYTYISFKYEPVDTELVM